MNPRDEQVELRQPIPGDPERALDAVQAALLGAGLKLERRDGGRLRFGLGPQTGRHRALPGLRALEAEVRSGTLYLDADLSRARFVRNLALGIGLGVSGLVFAVLAIVFWGVVRDPESDFAPWVAVATGAPWLLIAPWIGGAVRRSTLRGLQALAESAAAASRG